ncbi:hypothetical protein LY76DRAFT_351996 [Colletotrichum caudatum]|nr:hypothetical protein LY76DRAFT_351996 [Colletotrichum caudatum]
MYILRLVDSPPYLARYISDSISPFAQITHPPQSPVCHDLDWPSPRPIGPFALRLNRSTFGCRWLLSIFRTARLATPRDRHALGKETSGKLYFCYHLRSSAQIPFNLIHPSTPAMLGGGFHRLSLFKKKKKKKKKARTVARVLRRIPVTDKESFQKLWLTQAQSEARNKT